MISPSLIPNSSASDKFGDPFLLPSTKSFPTDIRSTLDLCLYLYRMNRLYGAAINRVVTYFITDLDMSGTGTKDDQDKLRTLLINDVGLFGKLQQAGMEWGIYGNAFVRCVEPFDRWLVDSREGGGAISLSIFPENLVRYHWDTMLYEVPDMRAAAKIEDRAKRRFDLLPKVSLPFQDKPSSAPERFSVLFLDPRYMDLDKAHHSDSVQYVYTVPPDMESRIKNNVLHEINNTPRGLLEAVSKNKDFRFHDGEVFHFKAPTPTGVSDSGWGCPEILLHYDTLYQIQVYRKADFAVAQDFLLPFRVFTPNFGDSAGDSVMTLLMSQWRAEISKMIANHRKDGTAIHALPFKADMQEYGGNGKQMVLHEVVDAHVQQLFDGVGMPLELFRGTMNVDQIPNAIRLFERTYEWMFLALSGLTRHIASVIQRAMDAAEQTVDLKRPSMAYNSEWMQLKMQLAANREMPRSGMYRDIGIQDPVAAAVEAAQEDQDIQRKLDEMAAKFEKERVQGSMADVAMMAAEQGVQAGGGGGAPAAGGDPAAGGAPMDYAVDPGSDPLQITQRAQEIAAQWIKMHAAQPNSHRKEMSRCEASNPTLFAAAKQEMEKLRSQGASQGRASVAESLG